MATDDERPEGDEQPPGDPTQDAPADPENADPTGDPDQDAPAEDGEAAGSRVKPKIGDTVLYNRTVEGHEVLPMIVTRVHNRDEIDGVVLTASPAKVGYGRPFRPIVNSRRGKGYQKWQPR